MVNPMVIVSRKEFDGTGVGFADGFSLCLSVGAGLGFELGDTEGATEGEPVYAIRLLAETPSTCALIILNFTL